MITTVPVREEDFIFLMELFRSTRMDEILSWGLDPLMGEQLLRMQWNAQTQSYQKQFPNADHRIIVVGKDYVGRMMIERAEYDWRLIDISLLPAYRKQGIGTQLLQGLLSDAKQNNRTLSLSVHLANPARRLYERLGFSVVEAEEVYIQMKWRG